MNPAIPLGIAWAAALGMSFVDGRRRWAAWTAVGLLALVTCVAGWLARAAFIDGPQLTAAGGWPPGLGIRLRGDLLGALFLSVSSLSLLAAMSYEALNGVRSRSMPAFMLFLAAALSGLFLTGDAFNFYVFFELAMVTSFVLSFYGQRRQEVRAGFIFVVVNILGSVLFLIAGIGLYRATGTLDMAGIAKLGVPEGAGVLIAAVLLASLSVKLGLFPFHTWLPPVYRGTSPAIAAVLSGAVANIGSYGLLRFGAEVLPGELARSSGFLIALGGASIIYGGIVAISREGTRDVVAYSSISQVGYILVALAAGGLIGLGAVVVYAVVNSLNKTALFLSSGSRSRLSSATFAIGAASVVGLPPTGGFLAKAAVLRAGAAQQQAAIVTLVVIGAALSFLYAFRTYQRSYWRAPDRLGSASASDWVPFGVGLLIVTVGLWPQPLLNSAQRAVEMMGAVP